jgi:hypothetical protein
MNITFSSNLRQKLLDHLNRSEYNDFFRELDVFKEHPILEESVSEIHEEWRKLKIAQKNKLMDDEQINLAIIAFVKRKSEKMITLLEEES